MKRLTTWVLVLVAVGAVWGAACRPAAAEGPAVLIAKDASALEDLAGREIVRYVYLRTGKVLPLISGETAPAGAGGGFVVARKGRPVLAAVGGEAAKAACDTLKPQEYLLKTVQAGDKAFVVVAGADDTATLWAAYRLAEHLGVRFYLHGDVVPDERTALAIPKLDERASPLFELRGIQPFHDFPEGPDWWNADDYKAILSQLPKMRMNFFGLHTYPEGGVGPEPEVWIGRPDDVGSDGKVAFAYASSWMNTLRGNWGYEARKTSDYTFGSAGLFEHDAYGGSAMIGHCPHPAGPAGHVEVFERAAALLKDAFTHARGLGVKTCVGTETPLIVPRLVRQRLESAAKKPLTPEGMGSLYEGMFTWIMRNYPLDYYWLWTPEGWTWGGVSDQQVQATIDDMNLALAAMKKVNAPFTLATCGWVLGPPKDRAMFDNVLPKNCPFSCINREVGKSPVEPGFAKLQGRPKWAIPWMEDDPNLISPQLWAGRMRKDAQDARKYGCTGLMGIHWRTRVLAPNVSALARAGWDQAYAAVAQPAAAEGRPEGPIGGLYANFPNNTITGADEPALYQDVRYDVAGYRLKLPNGLYKVTLKFCEPHYTQAGKRVFGVRVQGKGVIQGLDIFAKVGQNKALDYTYPDVEVKDGWLAIDFDHETEFPCIAAIAAEGPAGKRKINCGGPAVKDYDADWPPAAGGNAPRDRFAATGDFYADWAAAEFGPAAGPAIAKIFEKLDGHLPEPSTWIDGPGGIAPNAAPLDKVLERYGFVAEMEAQRPGVKGAGSLDRFDWWLNQFRYMAALERVKCLWHQYNLAWKDVSGVKDPAARKQAAREKALPARVKLVAACGEVSRLLLATVSNPGEMGTIMNWEQHLLPRILHRPGAELAKTLGTDLPADARPASEYAGPLRMVVPTLRSSVPAGTPLTVKVMVLAEKPPRQAALHWRAIGSADFQQVPLTAVGRAVHQAILPAQPAGAVAVEYYVRAVAEDGQTATFPASAPGLCQSVVVTEKKE